MPLLFTLDFCPADDDDNDDNDDAAAFALFVFMFTFMILAAAAAAGVVGDVGEKDVIVAPGEDATAEALLIAIV